VVECPVIPIMRVTLSDGRVFKAVVERDEGMFGDGTDLARLELLSADRFGMNIPPPELGPPAPASPVLVKFHKAPVEASYTGRIGTEFSCAAASFPGDSGSGVYDEKGRLIGILTRGSEHITGYVAVDASWLAGT